MVDGGTMDDPKRAALDTLRARVLDGDGEVSPAIRRKAALDAGLDGPVAEYVRTVHRQATEVTDAQIAALKAAGLSEDAIFELTVAAATGAGLRRLDLVLALLDAAP
jgi:hypothetical protein